MEKPAPPRLVADQRVGGLERVIARRKADPAAIHTLKCRTVARGRFSQFNYIRDLPPQAVMETEASDDHTPLGETTAPNASEALLAALGSCLAVGIHANAVAQRITVRSLELDVEADIDSTAVWGAGDLGAKAIGFEAIRVTVRMEADAPRSRLAALVAHATLWSPVANTLHNPVDLDVELAAAESVAKPV